MNLQLERIQGASLQALNRKFFLDVRRLTDKLRPKRAAEDQKLLTKIMDLIRSEPDVSQWDTRSHSEFIELVYELLSSELSASQGDGLLDPTHVRDFQSKADWLLNLALAGTNDSDAPAKLSACGFWARSRLLDSIDNLGGLPEAVMAVLGDSNINANTLSNRIKMEAVVHIGGLDFSGAVPTEAIEKAKSWCTELLVDEKIRHELYAPAVKLGVELPMLAPSLAIPSAENGNKGAKSTIGLWTLPTLPGPEELEGQRDDLIFDLLTVMSAMSSETATGVDALSKGGEGNVARQFYFAARDLWQTFYKRGDRALLPIIRRLALFSYSTQMIENVAEHIRRGTFRLWVNAQIPELMLAWPMPDLIREMVAAHGRAGLTFNEAESRAAIIEAFAGEARAREAEGDNAGRQELVGENREALQEVHREYMHRTRQANREPSDDELAAWEYLYPPAILPEPLPGPVDRIGKDPNFQMVIRRGDHDETYEFVTEGRDDIQKLLLRRLDVSFGPETLMEPTGSIKNPRGSAKNTADARFMEAKSLLSKENYPQAATLFGRLANQQDGTPQDIANDYWAYALAKQGIPSAAREKLSGLSDRYRFASAYWNQACCYSSSQNDLRLEVLERGLARSPHPKLLYGAVFLALLVNDTTGLKKLLSSLPFTEALLIYYQVAFDELDPDQKEKHIGRLVGYALNGEVELLDPLKGNLKSNDIEQMFDSFLARKHPEPIEFWMSCRETISYHRPEYWQIKTDYLERTGPAADAAKAFKEEVRARLSSLQRLVSTRTPSAKGQAQYLRRRVEKWLAQCQTPDLRSVGGSIYKTILKFKDDYEPVLRELEIDLDHRERFKRYFGEQASEVPGEVTGTGSNEGRSPTGAFEAQLIRTSSACESQLHAISDLPLVRTQLEELGEGLSRHGFAGSARELSLLIQSWTRYESEATDEGRLGAFQEAQKIFRELQSRLGGELHGNLPILAQPILKALNRVTNRLPRDTKLVPKLSVEALTGSVIAVDQSASRPGFAIRIRNRSDTAAVRIKKATAEFVGNLLECVSRDGFDVIPVVAEATGTAILTFSLPPDFAANGTMLTRIVVRYEYAGSEYETDPSLIELIHQPAPELPAQSPYIYGRMIEPEEIERHFFGREIEQKEVLDSIRDGQQRFLYIEGIRHSGKSSLLQSIQHEISQKGLPVIAVYYSMDAAGTVKTVGGILSNIFREIARHPAIAVREVVPPDEDKCNQNLPSTYSTFVRQLSDALPNTRILVMADEMHSLAEAGKVARDLDPALFSGIVGLLNLIRLESRPNAPLVWVFAGAAAKSQFSGMVPGASLWAQLRTLQIDFLPATATENIIREPLRGSAIDVPLETVTRVHQHTAGHPEVVQQLAELMLLAATSEKRLVLTPADADKAAEDLANSSDHLFAETWYPAHLLGPDQADLIAMLVNAVPPGGSIELFKLTRDKQVTDAVDNAVKDLVARKIVVYEGGIIRIKAYVLDLWLRRWVAKLVGAHQHGAPAFFLDLANLTEGKGTPYIGNLQTKSGEGIPGRFTWPTVLDRLDRYAKTFTPARFAAKWAVNYPAGSPAVTEVSSRAYLVENLPPGIRRKENDDRVLTMKIQDTERQYPNASHYFLILGDGDYEVVLDWLIKRGKFVHVCSRERAEADVYRGFSRRYPDQVTYKSLEDILEDPALQIAGPLAQ